jgi:hypothetical protein
VPANRGGHGVPERIVENELTTNGFMLVKRLNWPISSVIKHFCIVFVKPSGREGGDGLRRRPPEPIPSLPALKD